MNKIFLIIIVLILQIIACTPITPASPTLQQATSSLSPIAPTASLTSTLTTTPVALSAIPGLPIPHEVTQTFSLGNYIFDVVSRFGQFRMASIQTSDLNGDGNIDLIVGSEENNSQIQVYENVGNGVFRNSGAIFPFQTNDTRHFNFGIAVEDLNNDGLPDVASADAWGGLNIYLNQGNFRFLWLQNYTFEGMVELKGVAIADLNYDEHNDIVFGDYGGGYYVLFNDGTGRMVDSGQPVDPGSAWTPLIIDINRDGSADYLSANRKSQNKPAEPARIHINNGKGYFEVIMDIPNSNDNSFWIACESSNNNTLCFIANSEGDLHRPNRVLEFDSHGNLTRNSGFGTIGAETKTICIIDMNQDGSRDLVVGNYNGGAQVYFIKNENGTLNFSDTSTDLFDIDAITSMGCADFDGNGLSDFIVGVESQDHDAFLQYYLLLQRPNQ